MSKWINSGRVINNGEGKQVGDAEYPVDADFIVSAHNAEIAALRAELDAREGEVKAVGYMLRAADGLTHAVLMCSLPLASGEHEDLWNACMAVKGAAEVYRRALAATAPPQEEDDGDA